MKRILILILLSISAISWGQIVVDFFGISTCQSCAEMEIVLEGLQYEIDENVTIIKYDLSLPESQQLKLKYAKVFDLSEEIEANVPLFFIGEEYFTYDTADIESLLNAFEKYSDTTRNELIERINSIDDAEAGKEIEERLEKFSFLVVISAGLIDGINPCAFVVLLFLVSYLYFVGREKTEILMAGLFFSLGIFVAYLILGTGLLEMVGYFERASKIFRMVFYPLMTLLTGILAVLSIVDFFRMRYGNKKPVLQLSKGLKRSTHSIIRKYARSRAIWLGAFVAGLIISLVEFMCTGQIYLPTIVYLIKNTTRTTEAIGYLIIYNLGFIVPIIGITLLAYFSSSVKKIQDFMTETKAASTIKLVMAGLFIVFFIFMLQTSLKLF